MTAQGRVTRRDVMGRFGVRSKTTAASLLEALPGIDWFEDGTARKTRYYRIGTGQRPVNQP